MTQIEFRWQMRRLAKEEEIHLSSAMEMRSQTTEKKKMSVRLQLEMKREKVLAIGVRGGCSVGGWNWQR
ncbi:hypothetical protein AHAS_Ahas08G0020100 [Arachis hypogaea]